MRAKNVVLGVLFLDMLCQGLAYPSLPTLLANLGATDVRGAATLYGFLIASYALAELFGAPVLGLVSDRIGRKPVLIFSALASAGSYLLAATAASVGQLFLGYFLAGLTSAMMVVVQATLADVTPPEDRSKAFGMLGAVFGLGFVIGPAVGALMAPLGVRAPFLVSAGVMLVGGIAVAVLFPETRKVVGAPLPDWREFLPWRALGVWVRSPFLKRMAVTASLNMLALQLLISVWVPYNTFRFGLGIAENGWLLAGFGIAQALSQGVIAPRIISRLGDRRSLLLGLVASIFVYVGYGLAPTLWVMVGVLVIGTVGALDEPTLPAILSQATSDEEQGAMQGGLSALGSFMGILGPALGPAVFSAATDPGVPNPVPGATFYLSAVLILVGLLFARQTLRAFPQMGNRKEAI